MRTRPALSLAAASMTAIALSCGRVVESDLDPSRYQLAGVQFACQQWLPDVPVAEMGLFDIYWGRPSPDVTDGGPTERDRRLVQARGGFVVHDFHVRMIRAVLPPNEVPALGASVVWGVPLANDYPVDVFVRFSGAIDEDVVGLIEQRGGRILNRFDEIDMVAAVVPDQLIPTLRGREQVTDVEGVGLTCAQDRASSPS